MNINDIKVEKVALLLLVLFILVLFIDYTFGISQIVSKFYDFDIDIKQRKLLLMLVSISIIPILNFVSQFSFNKNSDIMVASITPFMGFVLGFYLYKIDFFQTIEGLILITVTQFLLSVTLFISFQSLLSKFLKCFNHWNKKLFKIKEDEKTEDKPIDKKTLLLNLMNDVNNRHSFIIKFIKEEL